VEELELALHRRSLGVDSSRKGMWTGSVRASVFAKRDPEHVRYRPKKAFRHRFGARQRPAAAIPHLYARPFLSHLEATAFPISMQRKLAPALQHHRLYPRRILRDVHEQALYHPDFLPSAHSTARKPHSYPRLVASRHQAVHTN